jgi:hypothetical protein
MKRSALALSLCLTMIALVSSAQAPDATAENEQKLLALAKEVQVQQAQLAENQAKIADKLNQLAEAIRVSRIFAARSE